MYQSHHYYHTVIFHICQVAQPYNASVYCKASLMTLLFTAFTSYGNARSNHNIILVVFTPVHVYVGHCCTLSSGPLFTHIITHRTCVKNTQNNNSDNIMNVLKLKAI